MTLWATKATGTVQYRVLSDLASGSVRIEVHDSGRVQTTLTLKPDAALNMADLLIQAANAAKGATL